MSLDAIIIGCSWEAVLFVGPTQGRSNADVTADLTGATAAAHLYATKTAAEPAAVFDTSVDAATRTIGLSLEPPDTATLTEKRGYVLDVRVTTVGGDVRPISLGTLVDVRRFSS